MKKVNISKLKMLFVLLALVVSNVIIAQPQGGGQGGGKQGPPPLPSADQIQEMVSDIADEIDASTIQEEQILNLYTAHFEEVEEMTSGNQRPDREEMESLKTEFEKEVKAVLSDEQSTKYTAYLKNNQKNKGQQRR